MDRFQAKLRTQKEIIWQQEDNNQHGLIVQMLTEMKFYLENIEGVIFSPTGREVFRCHKVVKDPLNAKIILFKDSESYLKIHNE